MKWQIIINTNLIHHFLKKNIAWCGFFHFTKCAFVFTISHRPRLSITWQCIVHTAECRLNRGPCDFRVRLTFQSYYVDFDLRYPHNIIMQSNTQNDFGLHCTGKAPIYLLYHESNFCCYCQSSPLHAIHALCCVRFFFALSQISNRKY